MVRDNSKNTWGNWSGEEKRQRSGPPPRAWILETKNPKTNCVLEQLCSKNCRTVYEVLFFASQLTSDSANCPRDKIYLATSKWRSIELRVTEALNETNDNVKYLFTLEKFIEPLYEGIPDGIKDTFPVLMNSIKMIHIIARNYNTKKLVSSLRLQIKWSRTVISTSSTSAALNSVWLKLALLALLCNSKI